LTEGREADIRALGAASSAERDETTIRHSWTNDSSEPEADVVRNDSAVQSGYSSALPPLSMQMSRARIWLDTSSTLFQGTGVKGASTED
jgi:hypothetical protein